MFDPTVGVWISEDPSGLGPDGNPYRYVKNDPTNFVDPTGLVKAQWSVDAAKGPDGIGDGRFGYTFKVIQSFGMAGATVPDEWTANGKTNFPTQMWQRNVVKKFYVTEKVGIEFNEGPILDVANVNIKSDVDTQTNKFKKPVEFGLGDLLRANLGAGAQKDLVAKKDKILAYIVLVNQTLGFRPDGAKPLRVAGNYIPTDAEDKLAQTAQGPLLHTQTYYIFIEKAACEKAKPEIKAKIVETLKDNRANIDYNSLPSIDKNNKPVKCEMFDYKNDVLGNAANVAWTSDNNTHQLQAK